jgi:crotonobetainyl-CoA:carnitine CoA-transferase CaiB-like acyl-CoA transferase
MMQPFAINDAGTGHFGAFGILLGLFHRLRTGEGQLVGASLAQTCTVYQTPYMVAYDAKVWGDEPGGLQCRGVSPLERLYKASDGWFFLAAQGPDAVERLARIDGLVDVARVPSAEAETVLARALAEAPAARWVERLTVAGFGAHLNRTIDEAMQDAWATSHGLSREVEFPQAGPGRLVGPAPRLSWTPMRPAYPAPPVGWDGEQVLQELGLGPRQSELVDQGAVVLPQASRVAA